MRTIFLSAMLELWKGVDGMNWTNLFGIFYYAAHTVAGIFDLILELEVAKIGRAGLWAWAVPGVCLVLLALDLTGRLSLRGSAAKTLVALLLPLLCSSGEMLLRDDLIPDGAAPTAWVLSLILLTAYVLLRGEKPEAPEVLLEHGSALGVALALWLLLMAAAVLFMATFGLLISLIVGGLIASKNGLLDYGGVKGLLSGLLALYILQCLWFWRGARLVRRDAPEMEGGVPRLSLLVPVWNMVQARRLALRLRGVELHY